ncbi:MAG: DUF4922 domain-containing protein [Bacteroidales bacterium]|nr:DUF4922 domain-containing protein [Bacteroidales bacterium]
MALDIDKFVHDQMSVWPEVAASFRALKSVRTRQLPIGGINATVQNNPARLFSCTAEVDEESLKARPCGLCGENRPQEQHFLPFEGRKGRKYEIIVNRFPIFPSHLVICSADHVDQSIWHRYVDMLDMAKALPDYILYYNGPASGASIPDHMHFQASPKGYLPLERAIDRLLHESSPSEDDLEYITSVQDAQLFHYKHFTRGVFALRAKTSKSMAKMFYRLLDCAPFEDGEKEPRFNAFTYYAEGEYRSFVVCRSRVRPSHYFAEGPLHYTISPGAADVAGYFIAPDPKDFERIDAPTLSDILSEVSVSEEVEKTIIWRLVRTQPKIEVGIMSGHEIVFEVISDGAGPQKVAYREGKIDYNGALYDELYFEAKTMSTLFAEPSFILYGVTIGVDFHWQRTQNQKFAGTLKFIVESGKVTAVNVIGVEDYLLSVISSEMKSSATLEFLKAHAVISRSWVMSQIGARREKKAAEIPFDAKSTPSLVTYLESNGSSTESGESEEYIKWFDHDDHKKFDVCADDHCQRYQGLTGAIGDGVRKAIDETWGLVMMSEGKIVDARFSKCCGGVMEKFSTCWEDKDYPYLVGKKDDPSGASADVSGDAREWILGTPEAFCNTRDRLILSQVLNDYDLETKDFYRWKEEYTIEALSELIHRRSGIDFGTIQDLVPLERGVSGRIKKLRIVGTKKTMVIGKELIIRRFLSESHLYSSAFIPEFKDGKVILRGAGWGHGVGLCQIGAAVMAYRGYTFDRILQHYYPGSTLERPQ